MPVGPWKQTWTGKRFYLLSPSLRTSICIEDIAHALSRQCRYGGHIERHYSVAQHSVLVAESLWRHDLTTQLAGLLHDAAEAYLCDVPGPFKQLPELEGFRRLETGVEEAIAAKWQLSLANWKAVKRADLQLLATEYRDLMGHYEECPWNLVEKPLPNKLDFWTAPRAERMFLETFYSLVHRRSHVVRPA